ncbi:MFS transporter [Halobacillus sp. B23F22_1]|uniref:MFS transporter n=1 Tax=Halobacillus sp. B23F22_1 TaxID=3459514 RepID=UPI00373EEE82
MIVLYRALWKNKNIRYYLLAGSVSRLGDVLSGMAFLFLAYNITKSSMLTTGMAVAEALPYLLFGLIGGVIADWVPKKKWLISLDLLRIPLILSVVVLYYLDMLTYAYLVTISFLIQSIGCFFNPAHRSILPSITTIEERTSANSMNDTLTRGVIVLSPVLSIGLLNTYGVIHFFTVDAITYLVSVLCLRRVLMKDQKHVSDKSTAALFFSIKETALWIKTQTTIRRLFTFTFVTVFLNTWVWEVGLLLALAEKSAQSEELYSLLQSVFGAMVILTNIILPYFVKKMTLIHYLIGTCTWGMGILYYGLLYEVTHFFIGCAIVGVGLPIAGLARVYLIQTLVPEDKLGRAFSFNAVLLYLSNTLSLALYGTLVSFIPIKWLMMASGLAIFIVSIGGLLTRTVNASKFRGRFTINFPE